MRYLTLPEVLEIHRRVIETSGGAAGVRDAGGLESAVAQPRMAFGGHDVYPDLAAKAAALCFSLAGNHAFVDGNKRVAHAATEVFLILNGYQLTVPVDAAEALMLALAAGGLTREQLVSWIREHLSAT